MLPGMIPFGPGRGNISPPSLPQFLRHDLREFPRRDEHEPTRLGTIREIRGDERDFDRFLTVRPDGNAIIVPPSMTAIITIIIIIIPPAALHTVPNVHDAVDKVLSFARAGDGEELAAGLEVVCEDCLVFGREGCGDEGEGDLGKVLSEGEDGFVGGSVLVFLMGRVSMELGVNMD
jgi:hypothetical protein